jgi:integrase
VSGRRLEIGEHGDVAYRQIGDKWTASFYYRNNHGQRRRIEATATSKTAARREALATLERVMSSSGLGVYSARTTFRQVAEEWCDQIARLVEQERRSPTTLVMYRRTLDLHVLPGIGDLRLSELSVARLDHFLHEKRRTDSYAIAKVCRSVTSGVCGFAVRRDAMRFNPVRDVAAIEQEGRKQARALTLDEVRRWLMILDADEYALRKDLPDLVRFLLGTGCRVGEALGVHWDDVDLPGRRVHIRRTVIRVEGQGLIGKRPKSAAGERVLGLPSWLVQLLDERHAVVTGAEPVFPDSVGGYRDRQNVERAFRTVRNDTEFDWVIPHSYRKTVATLMDRGGLSARTIADQLGHSRISMTQDFYLGRRAVDDSASWALEELGERNGDDDDDDPPGLFPVAG